MNLESNFNFNIKKNKESVGGQNPNEFLKKAQLESEFIEIKPENLDANGDLLAFPNGPKSNLEEKYWKLVRTPSFIKWFNKSKVVDENGEPALVFHTTNQNLDNFEEFSKELTKINRENKSTERDLEDNFYFSAYNRKYGRNRISAFVNSRPKIVTKERDILWLENSKVDKILKEGYDGLIFFIDDKKREIAKLKSDFRRTWAPKTMVDKVFFGLRKFADFENQLHALLDKDKARRMREYGKRELVELKHELVNFEKEKTYSKNYIYELCVFDSNQIMIVDKEKDFDLQDTQGSPV